MKIIRHASRRPASRDQTLRIIADGCTIDVLVGYHDSEGRPITIVEVSPERWGPIDVPGAREPREQPLEPGWSDTWELLDNRPKASRETGICVRVGAVAMPKGKRGRK